MRKQSGNPDEIESRVNDERVEEQDAVPAPTASIALRVQTDMYREGNRVALESAARTEVESVIDSLRTMARAAAKRLWVPRFDPARRLVDTLLMDRYRALANALGDAFTRVDNKRTELSAARKARAALHVPEPPGEPVLVGATAAASQAVLLSLTFYDVVFSRMFQPATKAFAIAVVPSIVIALGISTLILGNARQTTKRPKWMHAVWFLVSAAFAFGVYLMRSSIAITDDAQLLAIGLGLVEGTIVFLTDLYAQNLRGGWARYDELCAEADAVVAREEMAEKEFDDALRDTERLGRAVDGMRNGMTQREFLAQATEQLGDDAEAAVVAGYRAGISSNDGKALGVPTRPPSTEEVLEQARTTNSKQNGHDGSQSPFLG